MFSATTAKPVEIEIQIRYNELRFILSNEYLNKYLFTFLYKVCSSFINFEINILNQIFPINDEPVIKKYTSLIKI